jgi:hypothetical protein
LGKEFIDSKHTVAEFGDCRAAFAAATAQEGGSEDDGQDEFHD